MSSIVKVRRVFGHLWTWHCNRCSRNGLVGREWRTAYRAGFNHATLHRVYDNDQKGTT